MKKLNIQLLLVFGLLFGLNTWAPSLFAQDNYRVSGKVFTTTGHVMPNVEIALVGDTQTWLDTTGVDGVYSFLEIPENKDYVLHFKKEGEVTNGNSVEDAHLLLKHLIGIGGVSINGILGGDLDENMAISTLDAVGILRLALLGYEEPSIFNHRWQFIYAYANINAVNPFFPEPTLPLRIDTYSIIQLNQHMENIDFVGSKVGDINQSANPFE